MTGCDCYDVIVFGHLCGQPRPVRKLPSTTYEVWAREAWLRQQLALRQADATGGRIA